MKKEYEKYEWRKAKTKIELYRRYSRLIPSIREVAKEAGYAIGVHGTMRRDLDLMAMPWTVRAVSPMALAMRIERAVCMYPNKRFHKPHKPPLCFKCITEKPHGRIGYTIVLAPEAYIDLSIMPPK